MVKTTWLWWSSGKDSAWTLHTLRQEAAYDVTGLVTTVTEAFDRVSMHGVRTSLLRAQAEAVGLPLHLVAIPYPCPNGAYEAAAQRLIADAEAQGVTHMAFGDLFLEDVRAYREGLLRDTSIEPVFPLWGRDTGTLARSMVAAGVEAYLTCVDPKVLDPSDAGRRFDADLLDALPETADPCAERGEFHTFVADAPGFAHRIPVSVGEVLERDAFVFADIVPRPTPTRPDGAPRSGVDARRRHWPGGP